MNDEHDLYNMWLYEGRLRTHECYPGADENMWRMLSGKSMWGYYHELQRNGLIPHLVIRQTRCIERVLYIRSGGGDEGATVP